MHHNNYGRVAGVLDIAYVAVEGVVVVVNAATPLFPWQVLVSFFAYAIDFFFFLLLASFFFLFFSFVGT